MRRRSVPVPAALALIAALHAPLHAAPASRSAAPSGLGNVLAYAGCALSIVAAPTGIALVGAVLGCAVLIHRELPE